MSQKCEQPSVQVWLLHVYFIKNIALCEHAGNYGQTDKRTDRQRDGRKDRPSNYWVPRQTFRAYGIKIHGQNKILRREAVVKIFKVCRQSRKTFLLLRFPTLVGNLSVFVLSFIKVSDFSRKPFCFRFVFYYYFFPFFLLQLHRPVISSSILNGFTSNFQDIIIMTKQCTVWILRRIPQGVGTGRGPKV